MDHAAASSGLVQHQRPSRESSTTRRGDAAGLVQTDAGLRRERTGRWGTERLLACARGCREGRLPAATFGHGGTVLQMDHRPEEYRAKRFSPLLTGLLVAGILVALAAAVDRLFVAGTYYDEGGYLYEGWLACAKGIAPYRDFWAKVPPLAYYWYGWVQALFGPGLVEGRWQSLISSTVAVGLGAAAARKLGGPAAAVLLIWLVAGSDRGLTRHVMATAHAPVAFFAMLMVWGLTTDRRAGRWIAAVAAAGVTLVRQDLAIFAVLGMAYAAWTGRTAAQRWLPAVLCVGVFALVILPFAIMAPDPVLSSLSMGMLGTAKEAGPAPYVEGDIWTVPAVMSYVRMMGREYLALAIWPLILAAWHVIAGRARKVPLRIFAPHLMLLGIVIINPLGHGLMAFRNSGPLFYLQDIYVWTPLLVLGAASFGLLYSWARSQVARTALTVLAIAMVLVQFALTASLRMNRPAETALQLAHRGGEVIAAHVPPEAMVFTTDDPHMFLEAGRMMFPPLAHGLFAFRDTDDTARVDPRFYYNMEIMRQWLRDEADYVVYTSNSVNWMLNSGRYDRGAEIWQAIEEELDAGYRLETTAEGTLGGKLFIYSRSPD